MKVLRGVSLGAVLAASLAARPTVAQDLSAGAPEPASAPVPAPSTAPETPPPPATAPNPPDQRLDVLERRLETVESDNARLREELEQLRDDHEWTESRVEQVMPVTTKVSGYVDVGFFYVSGDGRGIRTDLGHEHFPEHTDVGTWVFMGDPLSTAINSRGDPADVTDSAAVTLNPINSNGKSSFIVNNVNVAFFAGIGDAFVVNALVDFLPRSRNVSASGSGLGDYLDVKLGNLEYRPAIDDVTLVVAAGKIDSLLGYEYRIQESPSRMTVTPSLICRYTCGRPVGLRATAGFLEDHLEVGAAVTNGSHVIEGFPFSSETDTNHFKTLAGRVIARFDVGAGLQFGASGAWGAQDFQANDSVLQRHIGGHVHFEIEGLELTGEYVRGDAEGEDEPTVVPPCERSPCLDYEGAYGLVGYRVNNWLVPYARADWRDALHLSGDNFVYVSESIRGTFGVRLETSSDVIAKFEYTTNQELGRIPDFPNDIYTSSLVGRF